MLLASFITQCCGMASHSSTSICHKSVNVVVLVTPEQTSRPRWLQRCSVGLRLTAGRPFLDKPRSVGASWVLETQNKNIRISCLHWQRSGTDLRCIYWPLLLLFIYLSFSFYPFRWDRSVVEPSQGSHSCRPWAPQMCEAGQASLWACAWAMLRDPQEEHPEIQQLHIPHRVRVSPPAAMCNISIKI